MLQGKSIPDPDSLSPHFHQHQSKTHLIISIFPLCRSIINIVNFLRVAAQKGIFKGNALRRDIPLIHHYTHLLGCCNGLMIPRGQFKTNVENRKLERPMKKIPSICRHDLTSRKFCCYVLGSLELRLY